ncbi:unnamed protein product [Rhizoctonia solani]|uniref:BTB domain-containing protein n=1 Tax=Rhizoctonia solani TaxID=456999 RepID=A0A8H3DIP2_9AGAM|nr:unnamed protein product [Rhizoctonia solani]
MSKKSAGKLTSRAGRWVFIDVDDTKSDSDLDNAPSTKDSEPPERHPEFFFDNTLVAIQIGKTLFNVHKYQLAKSEVFSDMFKMPKPEGGEPEGSSPEHPIKLEGVSASDFAALLRVLYASHFSSNQPTPEASLVIPAFRLANMFNFSELRAFLLPLAEGNLNDVDKIIFAREFDIKECQWVLVEKASDAKSNDNPNNASNVQSSAPPKRHPEFFFDNTLVAIQGSNKVENTLFNVHKYQLVKAEVFSDMFKIPKPSNSEYEEGFSPEHPIMLEGVSASDFSALLRVLYASHFSSNQPAPEASLVVPAFCLVNLFNFSELRAYLLPLAEQNLNDVDKIVFAREFDIQEWLAPAHVRLCRRETPLNSEEATKLGVQSVLLLSRLREQHRTRTVTPSINIERHYCDNCDNGDPIESYSAYSCYCHSCDRYSGLVYYSGSNNAKVQNNTTSTNDAAVEKEVKEWLERGSANHILLLSTMLFLNPPSSATNNMSRINNQNGSAVFIGKASDVEQCNNPCEIPSARPSESIVRHPEFFFDNTLIAIQIENTLFNVHKYQLVKSEVFSEMFKMPKSRGDEPEEGSSPEHPIVIHGAAASDFAALLKVLYASHFSSHQPAPEAPLIIPAFRLANLLGFSELHNYLLPLAEKNLADVDKIVFAREFGIKEWLTPALIRLCQREAVLSTEEARKLEVDSVLLIWSMREQYRNRADSISPGGGVYCQNCTGWKYHGAGSWVCQGCLVSANAHYTTYAGPGKMQAKLVTNDAAIETGVKKWVEDNCVARVE